MIRIDVLPDDILLEIFDFHMVLFPEYGIEVWKSLIHVCRRWRYLVFGSPRRLNLRLRCTHFSPTRDKLDIWPALPLVVEGEYMDSSLNMDNIIAALEQRNRVCEVFLRVLADRQLEKVLAAMQVPFPELTRLYLMPDGETELVIPDSFLGGSAPSLRSFILVKISFPGLPNLLLSATHLADLRLCYIPHSGYISPEAMVALISVLSGLKTLYLQFESPESRPVSESRSLPPIKRAILPALTILHFQGVTEYLEELVTRIDTPQLDEMKIYLFNQIGSPRLAQFINRTSLRAGDKARVNLIDWHASVILLPALHISILCREPDRPLLSVAQVCNPLQSLSTVKGLYIGYQKMPPGPVWNDDDIEDTLWLQLLLPFTAVKNLYLSKVFVPSIAAALKELVGGRMIEVLPSLQNIFVGGLEPSGPLQEDIGQFIAARRLSDHPIAISDWDRDSM
jgi:hypothetical protein